jgi:hypothetical protein
MSGALTIGPGLTLRGGSGPFSDQYLSGEPNIGSDASPLINQGHIVADGLHSLLIVGGSTINNQGTLEVTNGATLAIDAAFSLATIGTLVNNGGAFAIRNSFDNTGQTLQIDNAHGWWLGAGSPFNPATIHGGTIETHDGKGLVIPYENTGQLDAVVLNGKVILDGNLIVPSGQTFTGNGEIAIDNPEAIEGSGNVGTASGKTSIGAGVLVHGGIDSSFDFSPGFKAAVGNDREILDNLGTISVDENGKQMYLIGSTINNSGVLEVVSGAQLRVFGDLIFFDESRLKIDGGGSVNIDNTILSGVENLDLGTPNDFLDVTPFAGGGPYDNFLIVSYTGTLIGAFSHVTPGITVSYATPGEIRISGTPIPEPGLTSMAFVSLMCLHRRRAGNLN